MRNILQSGVVDLKIFIGMVESFLNLIIGYPLKKKEKRGEPD
jgi:hypothetical protein